MNLMLHHKRAIFGGNQNYNNWHRSLRLKLFIGAIGCIGIGYSVGNLMFNPSIDSENITLPYKIMESKE